MIGGRPIKPDFAAELAEREKAAAAERTRPVVAHCPTCEHDWTVCYLPMPIDTAAALMKAARCPKGCSAGPRVGSLV